VIATGGSGSEGAEDRLRQLEVVTDRALAYLDVEDLLVELLDRARELLDVDTAAVLLVDPSGTRLVATAARGLEEEVRQGTRIPLGRGFAGRVAGERRPIQIENVDSSNVLNPILLEVGVRSLLGVPLVVEGEAVGVLHVGTLKNRVFDSDEVDLLQLVGDRIALAVGAHISAAERSAVRTLQRGLMPERLVEIAGLELAARYVGGGGGSFGGDWYDFFSLPSGSVCLAVGDVAGKGLNASIVMGRIRTALRSYALDTEDPAEILHRVDRQLRHFEPGAMATVLCATSEPPYGRFRVSLAGHLPPVVALPSAPAHFVEADADPPLGALDGAHRRTAGFELPPGAVVCVYTDGLVERRGEHLDVGLERIRSAVLAAPPESVCASVMARLIGTESPGDDVAVLVARREGNVECP